MDFRGQSFSFAFWANRSSTATEDRVLDANGLFIGLGTNRFFFWFIGGDNLIVPTPVANETDAWHHWAGSYDSASGERKLYLDGELIGEDVSATGVVKAGGLRIGGSAAVAFHGRLDEIRLWNVVRSQADIQADKNLPLSGDETGLVGYWRFDEGTGNTALDETANANDGSFVGEPQWLPTVVGTRTDCNRNGTIDECEPGNVDSDGDGDGVPDACDVCSGGDDRVDSDDDGVPDDCDACPGFDDALDGDGDGIPDDCDNCPTVANEDQADHDGDADLADLILFQATFTGAR